jgi:hypothetical protein
MTPQGPLTRRIAERRGIPQQPAKVSRRPLPPVKPAWLERLTARDETGRLS